MGASQDAPIAPLIRELEEAFRMLLDMHALTPPQAERIAADIDRLTSQLAYVSPPVRAGRFDAIDRSD